MATASVDVRGPAAVETPPYRTSWFDAVIAFIDRWPLGRRAFFIGYAAFWLAYLHIYAWLSGTVAVGSFDASSIVRGFYPV